MSWGEDSGGGWSRPQDEPRRLSSRDLHVTITGMQEVVPGGIIRNRTKTAYNAGEGFYLGIPSTDNVAVFGIGDETNYLTWDGTTLSVQPNLSALNADLGTITTGTISMYTGTWDVDANGFRLTDTEIAGQLDGEDQVDIRSTDGKLRSGAGQVILQRSGIEIQYDTSLDDIGYGISTYGVGGYGGVTTPIFLFTRAGSNKQYALLKTTSDQFIIAYSPDAGSDGYANRWIFNADGTFQLPQLTSSPASPQTGAFTWADGTNWNPGAGAGPYVYDGSAWRKLIGYGN